MRRTHCFFYKKMKQSKEIRGLSMSSIRSKSISWLDSTSLTTVSSILDPTLRVRVARCLKPEYWSLPKLLLFGLAALIPSFLKEDETERDWTALTFGLLLIRFETLLSMVVAAKELPYLSPPLQNLLLGDGDPSVLTGLSGCSFLKLFCLVRLVGEFDRTLFCGIVENDPTTLCGGECCFNIGGAKPALDGDGFMLFLGWYSGLGLVLITERDASLSELMRVMCGLSL